MRRAVPTSGERRAAVEAAIVSAAEELLTEGHTFTALSVEQIASRAGIGRTAFYFYFRDKRDVLLRLGRTALEELYEEADRWWSGTGDGPEELRRSLAAAARRYLEHAAVLRVVTEAATYEDDVREFWSRLIDRFVEATCARIELEQAAGRAGAMPARETAAALIWMSERLLYQYARGTLRDFDEMMDALSGAFERTVYGHVPQRA